MTIKEVKVVLEDGSVFTVLDNSENENMIRIYENFNDGNPNGMIGEFRKNRNPGNFYADGYLYKIYSNWGGFKDGLEFLFSTNSKVWKVQEYVKDVKNGFRFEVIKSEITEKRYYFRNKKFNKKSFSKAFLIEEELLGLREESILEKIGLDLKLLNKITKDGKDDLLVEEYSFVKKVKEAFFNYVSSDRETLKPLVKDPIVTKEVGEVLKCSADLLCSSEYKMEKKKSNKIRLIGLHYLKDNSSFNIITDIPICGLKELNGEIFDHFKPSKAMEGNIARIEVSAYRMLNIVISSSLTGDWKAEFQEIDGGIIRQLTI